MKHFRSLLAILFIFSFLNVPASFGGEEELFITLMEKERFARDISSLIEKAWIKWQDKVVINNVYVNGSQGVLLPGAISEPVLTRALIMRGLDRAGKSQAYIDCVRAVAGAVENGMRLWQKGYAHDNIPFPQGASCVYTMPPSYNVPVMVATGRSSGDREMSREALYNYMLYRVPYHDKQVLSVCQASAAAISECFLDWERTCCIKDILASGGVAPQPVPMGPGPGMVRGAKGNGGKFAGTYFDGKTMCERMITCFKQKEEQNGVSGTGAEIQTADVR